MYVLVGDDNVFLVATDPEGAGWRALRRQLSLDARIFLCEPRYYGTQAG